MLANFMDEMKVKYIFNSISFKIQQTKRSYIPYLYLVTEPS